jgi:hypothetical protein
METLTPQEPTLAYEKLEAFLKRLKPDPASANRLLHPFDPEKDEWGWQQEED